MSTNENSAPATGNTPTERKPSAETSGKAGTEARQFQETRREQGRRWGMHFKAEGRDYGRLYGHYPSCVLRRDEKTCEYCLGYEEGFGQ